MEETYTTTGSVAVHIINVKELGESIFKQSFFIIFESLHSLEYYWPESSKTKPVGNGMKYLNLHFLPFNPLWLYYTQWLLVLQEILGG